MIDSVVNNTILPQENKYLDEIKEQKHKYENDHLNDLKKKIIIVRVQK
jgi:hypothetical protein